MGFSFFILIALTLLQVRAYLNIIGTIFLYQYIQLPIKNTTDKFISKTCYYTKNISCENRFEFYTKKSVSENHFKPTFRVPNRKFPSTKILKEV